MTSLLCLLLSLLVITCTEGGEQTQTQCGLKEASTSFLDLAVEFIKRAKDNFPTFPMSRDLSCSTGRPVDCEEVLRCGLNKSGVYNVWPRNKIFDGQSIKVFCDMDTDKGGWTVIQRRGNFSKPYDYFFKDWDSYKKGFGNIEEDFWLGNDNIYALTNQRLYSARFDLTDVEGQHRYVLYEIFWIDSEQEKYKLTINDYSGNANDSMDYHNGNNFSTKDRDNDEYKSHCAQVNKGGWWFKACHHSNLNGLYLRGKHPGTSTGVVWYSWKGYFESMDKTEIKIRPKNFHEKFLPRR